MKKLLFAVLAALFLSVPAYSISQFIENTDYMVDFNENKQDKPAVLHINFGSLIPSPEEAEKILKNHLKNYGSKTSKNIIGSVWYKDSATGEMSKIKYNDSVASYVWINKTKRIVSFPEYISFLKRERDSKRDKARAEARKQAQEAALAAEAQTPAN